MTPFTLNIRGTLRQFVRPTVMGILNVTPDSFYEKSRTTSEDMIARRVRTLIDEGADFIDIGAYSTRPGATDIPVDEEIRRLKSGMKILREITTEAIVSVDTFRAEVAETAVSELGCDIINDISGGTLDPEMFSTAARLQVPYILAHTRGTPTDMHSYARYEDITSDVLYELGERLQQLALEGVCDIVVDPGIGFAKTTEQNYRLIHDLETFGVLHRPVMVGVSRKSLITDLLGISADDALEATTALNAMCLDRGASILRVHDVKTAADCIRIHSAIADAV